VLVLLENWQLTLKKKININVRLVSKLSFLKIKNYWGNCYGLQSGMYASLCWVCCICHNSFQVSAMYEGPIRLEDAILNNLWPFFFPFGSSLYWRGGADNFCSWHFAINAACVLHGLNITITSPLSHADKHFAGKIQKKKKKKFERVRERIKNNI